jgi:hypothetical protein
MCARRGWWQSAPPVGGAAVATSARPAEDQALVDAVFNPGND